MFFSNCTRIWKFFFRIGKYYSDLYKVKLKLYVVITIQP